MREPSRDPNRLHHILEQIEIITEYVNNHTYEELMSDRFHQYGLVKSLEIIGEAAYMLTKEFRAAHPKTNWNIIVNMRHVLVHGYFNITMPLVWETAIHDIPKLRPQIEEYIAELES